MRGDVVDADAFGATGPAGLDDDRATEEVGGETEGEEPGEGHDDQGREMGESLAERVHERYAPVGWVARHSITTPAVFVVIIIYM